MAHRAGQDRRGRPVDGDRAGAATVAGARRNNDALDAAAAASVAALQGDGNSVVIEGASPVLGMLDERRTNLAQQRTRMVNQLHALLRELLPGGDRRPGCRDAGAGRPASPVEQARKDPARDLVADIRALDSRSKASQKRMQDAVEYSGSSRPDIVGVGPVVAARVLGRASRASRFRTAAAFAVHVGAARIEIASADKARHRLSCQDDRKLDNALHAIALTQVRMSGTRGRAYARRGLPFDEVHDTGLGEDKAAVHIDDLAGDPSCCGVGECEDPTRPVPACDRNYWRH